MGLEYTFADLMKKSNTNLGGYITTSLDWMLNVGRKHSLWPMPFGTACCAIEMMSVFASEYDMSRFGAEVMRFSPRQSDMMIVSGRIAVKMMPILIKIYEQMPEPKWVVSMGACCSTGGIFDTYTMIQGINQFLPVDVFIPGCPPRPEAIMEALFIIQKKIEKDKLNEKYYGS